MILRRTASALLLLLPAAPGAVLAQAPYPGSPPPLLEWPAPGSGAFGHAALCELDGDELRDLAQLRGGGLQVVTAVGLAPFGQAAPGGALAFDVLPEVGPGGADVLFTSAHDGIWRLDWDPSSEALLRSPVFSHPAWLGCPEIGVRTTGGAVQLALLNADARTVAFLQAPGWEPSPWTIVSPAGGVLDMALFDSDGDGADEVALLGPARLELWKQGAGGWVLAASWERPGTQGLALCSGRTDGDDWLAWLADAPGGQEVGIVLAGEIYGVHSLGARGVSTLAAGDWSHDALDDLYAGWSSSRGLGVYQDRQDAGPATTPQFSDVAVTTWTGACAPTADLVVVPSASPGPPAPTTGAVPAPGDIDGDGDVDVVHGVEAAGSLLVALNGCTDHAAMKPRMTTEDQSAPPRVSLAEESGHLHLQFGLELALVPAGANAVEVLLFRREVDEPGGDTHDTDPLSCAGNLFLLPTAGPPPAALQVDLPLTDPDGQPVPSTNTTLGDDMYFWIERYVRVDLVTHEVLQAFPGEVAGIQASCDWNASGCLAGAAHHQEMLSWRGTSEIEVDLAEGDSEVIGNGLVLPTLPDLGGPMRRTPTLYIVVSNP